MNHLRSRNETVGTKPSRAGIGRQSADPPFAAQSPKGVLWSFVTSLRRDAARPCD
jgi:hypothetical protein